MWSANRRLAADWRNTGHVDWVGLDCYLSRPARTYANTVALDGRRIQALTGKPFCRPRQQPGPGRETSQARSGSSSLGSAVTTCLVWSGPTGGSTEALLTRTGAWRLTPLLSPHLRLMRRHDLVLA